MIPCTQCHNCGSIWGVGSEEYDWQKCDACGWEPGQPIDNDEDDFDVDDELSLREEDFDQQEQDNDPNDSRNL